MPKISSNALLTADGLGLFGREQVDLASYWGLDDVSWPTAYAFRIYRNYDGKGGRFGTTSVQATSADATRLPIYAAQRSDGALTLMVINKTQEDQTSAVALAGLTNAASEAAVYRYSQDDMTAITHLANLPLNANGFSTTFPANSMTMIVIPTSGTNATPTPTNLPTPTNAPTPTACPTAAPTVELTPIGNAIRRYIPLSLRGAGDC